MNMRRSSFIVMLVSAMMLAGVPLAYGGSIQGSGPWGTPDPAPKGGTVYSGELVITGNIANTPGLPGWAVPAPPNPALTAGYNDVLATLTFVMKLTARRAAPITFSGLGKRPGPLPGTQTTYFNLPADYVTGTLGQAVKDFVLEKCPTCALTSVVEVHDNVTVQLDEDEVGGGMGTESPLYMWLEVEVVRP